jgi:hypothetical protein
MSLMLSVFALLAVPSSAQTVDVSVELGGVGAAMAHDPVRQVIYVSVPSRNEVVVVSTTTYQIVDRIVVGSRPRGLDLSSDGTRLFAALNGSGSVAVLDLTTKQVTEIDVSVELGHSETWDVVEAQPGRLFVTASPNSSGFAWVVQVLLNQSNTASRVASNYIIRAMPVFAESPDGLSLYIGEGFSPNSIYKLDLSSPVAPIVLEDVHGSVYGTDQLAVSPDSLRINTGGGQVLRTGSLTQAGVVTPGIPRYGATPGVFYVAEYPGFGNSTASLEVTTWDRTTLLETGSRSVGCTLGAYSQPADFAVLSGDQDFVVLASDLLCVSLGSGAIADSDGDGVGDVSDNCVNTPNPGQQDADSDHLGDDCDPYPTSADNLGACVAEVQGQASLIDQQASQISQFQGEVADLAARIDTDLDGVPDVRDRCPATRRKKKVDANGCSKSQR